MLHLREVLTRCIFVGLCADMAKAAKDEFHTHPMAQSVGEHLPDTISTAIHSTHAELEGVLASCVALLRAVGSEQQEEKVEKESGGRLCFCSRWRLGKCSLFFFFFFFFFGSVLVLWSFWVWHSASRRCERLRRRLPSTPKPRLSFGPCLHQKCGWLQARPLWAFM